MEVGWSTLSEAEQLHQNDTYLVKKEIQIEEYVVEKFQEFNRQLKFFLMVIGKHLNHREGGNQGEEVMHRFQVWRSKTYFKSRDMYSPVTKPLNTLHSD
mmetsp:Transcript_29451/g.28597  ORF Transcript_29451/g.28597 Transcript_29451/m.28597 type:complete len:99 (-) Transcript_29451:124-420(-)